MVRGFSRIKETISLKVPDVLPAVIWDQDFIVENNNENYTDFILKPGIMSKCLTKHMNRFDLDYVIVHGDDWLEVEELGVKLTYPENESPAPIGYPVQPGKKINNIKIPDYSRSGRMRIRLEAIKALKGRFNNDIAIIGHVNAPFTMATMIIGLQESMVLIYDNPDFLNEIIEISFNNAMACAKAQIEAGANMLWIGDTTASSWLINLDQFKKWALPYEKKLINYIHSFGVFTFIQLHEKETARIEALLDSDSDIINVANKGDLKEAFDSIRGRKCIFGNIDPESILWKGDMNNIKEKVDRCKQIAGNGAGYIIGCCDNLPRYTPVKNYEFFFEYIRNLKL